ncbi:MAG TPA: D-2-hydroxyacid dehydrogenase [Xanthobacteraceae bacterium]
MTNVLFIMNMPQDIRLSYRDDLKAKFPALTVNVVDHHSKVGPYIGSVDVVMAFGPHMADHVIKEAPNLKWIQALTTGTDGIDDCPSLRSDILLTSLHGIHGNTMSETALMLMLALSRKLPQAIRNQDRRKWERLRTRLLHGRTVGIFGVGAIGEALAPKCKAMGMQVVGIDPIKRNIPDIDAWYAWDDVARVIGEIDYAVLLIPSTPATKGIINAKFLGGMKPTSYLINLGRGPTVDDAALLAALQEGRIAGAALDVFNPEPLPADHPYWSMSNVLVTAHNAGFFDEYEQYAMPIIEDNMKRFLAGDTKNMVNLIEH